MLSLSSRTLIAGALLMPALALWDGLAAQRQPDTPPPAPPTAPSPVASPAAPSSGVASPGVASPAPKLAFAEPGISPDGREIAFVSGGDIWTVPATGGEARLLVSHTATESRPLYSPDGA